MKVFKSFARSISSTRSISSRTLTTKTTAMNGRVEKSEDEWKAELSSEEFRVLRMKGTESPGTGKLNKFYPKAGEGYFACRACMNPLYSAQAKFDSGCGWPAFDKCYKDSIKTEVDNSMGMNRVEIMCASCDGHLGHSFTGEGFTSTNERHCVNSVSIKFIKNKLPEVQEEEVLQNKL